jgi:hypothetical protein
MRALLTFSGGRQITEDSFTPYTCNKTYPLEYTLEAMLSDFVKYNNITDRTCVSISLCDEAKESPDAKHE